MIRGTTPTHKFILPFGTEMIKSIEICYAQNNVAVLTKEKDGCSLEDNTVNVKLTQEETLKFAEGVCAEVQVRVLTMGGDALASPIMRVHCGKLLSDGVLE